MTIGGGPAGPDPDRATSGPLTSAQKRMWLLEEMGVGWPAYMIDYGLRLRGDVHLESLRCALGAVFQNHEVLRTRYRGAGEDVRQVVVQEELRIHEADFVPDGSVSLADQLWEAARAIRRPLDGDEAPFVVQLLRVAPDDVIVLMSAPHISLDLRSLRIIREDLCTLYQAACDGEPPAPPTRAAQYLRYAAEQFDRPGAAASDESYWCARLEGTQKLAFPADFPRPPQWSGEGAGVEVRVPALVADTLRHLGRQNGASPYMAFLTVCMVGLARFTGQSDIAVGVPLSGRTEPWTEEVVGCFVETVVARVPVAADSTYLQILSDVRDAVLEGMEHPLLPFEKIISLSGGRDPSSHPIYQAMVTYEELDRSAPSVSGLQVEELSTGSQAAKMDMVLHLAEMADRSLVIGINYATGLFKPSTMQAFAGRLTELARSMARSPETPLTEHARPSIEPDDMVTAQGAAADGSEVQVHELVKSVAVGDPGRTAVVDDAGQASYTEVEAAAALLAARLPSYPDQTEIAVGICVESALQAVIAVLGVMKAGLSFLLLDAREPHSAVKSAVDHGDVRIVVTDQATMKALGSLGVDLLDCAGTEPTTAAQPVRVRDGGLADDALACLICIPAGDGVESAQLSAVSRAALRSRILRQSQAMAIEPGSRVLVDGPMDSQHWLTTTFGALVAGATVVTGGRAGDGPPPSRQALDGPAAAGDRLLALDGFLVPVAAGEVGGLFTDGPSLARGFVGNPALTAERYRPNPYSGRPGARMYDTGYVGLHTAEGDLVVLGSRSRRLRIQGMLVDLSEIEAALERHPLVEYATVTASELASGEYELSATVTSAQGEGPLTEREIRGYLHATVPRPMVPQNIEVPSGAGAPGAGLENTADSDLGQLVAQVWKECLSIDEVNPATDFFWTGGHSLVAAQISAHLSSLLPGVRIPAAALFDVPVFADFLDLVERSVQAADRA